MSLRQLGLRLVALIILFYPVFSSAETQWIFPGQSLPADVPYFPLRTGLRADSDIQVQARDWFLLRPSELAVPDAAIVNGRITSPSGPVLTETNAQIYFRLVSGMILKESLIQMGANSAQAKLLIDRIKESGRSFDEIPVSEMGDLPHAIDDLYERWQRPMARAAIIPYLVLPLSIANDQSSFQHFQSASIDFDKCSTITNASPINQVQARLNERRDRVDQLNTNVRNASALIEQSSREQERLATKVKEMSGDLDEASVCLVAIRERVARGASMPSEACLTRMQGQAETVNLATQWAKFVAVNLKNEKGDLSTRQAQDLALKALEAKLLAARNLVNGLKEANVKTSLAQAQNEEKLKKLQLDRDAQNAQQIKIETEIQSLHDEYQGLQTLRFKLDQGILAQEQPEAQVIAAIKATSDRNRRAEEIKIRQSILLESKRKLQANQAIVMTQIEFLKTSIDNNQAEIRSIMQQLGTSQAGLLADLTEIEKQVASANASFLQASDQYNFADYVISGLARKLSLDTQARDGELALLKKEETTATALKQSLVATTKVKDNSFSNVKAEIKNFENLLVNYYDENHMGWFLEQNCQSRQAYSREQTGLYLSRSPVIKTRTDSGPVDGGKWGLFNIDYSHFQNAINSGVLLNLSDYIRLVVQHSISNLDYAVQRNLDSTAPHCKDANSNGTFTAALPDLLGSAFAIWSEGSDLAARSKLYCRGSEPKQSFLSGLMKFLEFKGTVLDQALPQVDVGQENGIEREAISLLLTEMRGLTGLNSSDQSSSESERRRDRLVKALLKVLAYDYDAAVGKSREAPNSKDVRRADQAPGKNISAERGSSLALHSVQTVRGEMAVKLYRSPIVRVDEEIGISLNKDDQVTVLSAVQGGWVQVEIVGGEKAIAWMSANALDSEPIVAPLRVANSSASSSCSLRRLVTGFHPFVKGSLIMPRFLPELKVEPSPIASVWQLNWSESSKAPSGSITRTYVACEVFSVLGKSASLNGSEIDKEVDYSKAIALRLIEVRKVRSSKGLVKFEPLEDYGAFVQTWMPQRWLRSPRIELGPKLDADWSLKQ
jgi:hypothetical protein